MTESVSAVDPHPRHRVSVLDGEMAYARIGTGEFAIVFLHGNPTSSYLWRNVMPAAAGLGRCLAPDLIGMGQSSKIEGCLYTFADHARYLDAWFGAVLPQEDVVLVIHDWGSALGFHWARRNPDRVRAIVYMESIVRPVEWDEWPEAARSIFRALRSPAGEEMVLEKNVFVENILPGSILRDVTAAEMEVYRRPYLEEGESRRPTLTWPREIPLGGEPADVVEIVETYSQWLASSPVPKLFVNADPGAILIGPQREFCRSWPNQTEITVKGNHFVQEDSPTEIGAAIRSLLSSLPD